VNHVPEYDFPQCPVDDYKGARLWLIAEATKYGFNPKRGITLFRTYFAEDDMPRLDATDALNELFYQRKPRDYVRGI
jgi:hypothetical protein